MFVFTFLQQWDSTSRVQRGLLFAFIIITAGCSKGPLPLDPFSPPSGVAIVETARTQIGTPYRWGGASPETGFDCSGLIQWVYAQHGYGLPRMTEEQIREGRAANALRAGDLVFFRIGWKSLHTGLSTGRGTFIHSPAGGGSVREDSLDRRYWQERFLKARRILDGR
ncbi:MAG: C40 family peptidase [Desulfovibrionales bacterium]